MGSPMLGTLSRLLLLTAAFGALSACDMLETPAEEAAPVQAPVAVAPAKKAPVSAAPAPVPVKKKPPVVIDFDDGGSGGGGWN
jgi:hypothetical protein